MSDTTFNEEIIVFYNSVNQKAEVTASKCFESLTQYLGTLGTYKKPSLTENKGTGNYFDKNTATYDEVFSDFMLVNSIEEYLKQNKFSVNKIDPVMDSDEKTTRISIVLNNVDIKK